MKISIISNGGYTYLYLKGYEFCFHCGWVLALLLALLKLPVSIIRKKRQTNLIKSGDPCSFKLNN